ncbi:D-alanyl-D-alanine carboxypeptidase (penicillin-binding protein 5/6) [Paenibacillus sp. V4I3]|uniref:D-alanyl-D-alanine carboxypeptidase family protein n=1 Tax=unclassified Paenibacillus TaxID=185978 RepID=UPI00278A6B3E|nr:MULTISPECIES: D-alanyl-D-alanine carboxypeptidase family protein [unclassified Paenibacillus]MDQ0875075.1 D-alanyl-D-alanine carboxypeptidase (penicillin-binding protein 5/6) [Paenibacillus sp. V4I3]MDQ0889192.1 D-alanyl-D-alanine carboxypeptidase (penicillin-binding protein 5/6) [Paenibacillus sp. V4I9]
MKIRVRFILLWIAIISLLWAPFGQVEAAPPGIHTNAVGASLIDVESGRILYSEKGDTPMRIASLTKIMTAIIAIEEGKLTDKVKVSKNAFGKEGSSIYLKLGEEMRLHDMLYGLMMRSGNDAATAIAEHIGGSVEGFVYLMNEKAKMLGMDHSHFTNPSGLDEGEGHRSSPNDMAKLTAYALKNAVFQDIVSTKIKKVPNPNEAWDYSWLNKNKMLSLFEGADGVKTGYTKLAKRCLVSSATRNGQHLAVVTLNDPDDWGDHARLLQYGFKYYPLQTIVKKGDAVEGTPWVVGRSFSYPLAEGEAAQLTRKVVLVDPASMEYRLAERGTVQFSLNQKSIQTVPIYDSTSPLLQTTSQSTFSFKEGNAYKETWFSHYGYICRLLVQSLFTVSESQWAD